MESFALRPIAAALAAVTLASMAGAQVIDDIDLLAAGSGGPATGSPAGLHANNMSLYVQLTMGDLGYPSASGNDCWGYTSLSGREYALMGTSEGTVVVEISDPSAPVVIDRIDGVNGLWRDIRTYGTRAYAVAETGHVVDGIQVIDLSGVDSGTVTLENFVSGNGASASHNVVIDEVSGILYLVGGGNNGLRAFSLTNPSTPTFMGEWSTLVLHDAEVVSYTTGPLSGREIAYCSAGGSGLMILDVTDKTNMFVLSQLTYPGLGYAHQGWLSTDRTRFYLGDELDELNNGIVTTTYVFDVADPANASYTGAFDNGVGAIGHNMFGRDGLLFQANYTSGIRVFDLNQNPDSPPEVGYFDMTAGSNFPQFEGMWGCFVDFASGTVIGSDTEEGLLILHYGPPEVQVSLAAPPPTALDLAGAWVDVEVTELITGTLDPASPKLVYDMGAGPTTVPLVANGGTSYTAVFPPMTCGVLVDWYVSAAPLAGPVVREPASAPETPFVSVSATYAVTVREDDMESAAGWVGGAPGDTATEGQWTRAAPVGTPYQPSEDASALGTQCWFTGQGTPFGDPDGADVDGGRTTLLTPIMDMSTFDEPRVAYYRWFNNGSESPATAEVFDIEITANGGATWVLVERIGPSGPDVSGVWVRHSFAVTDFIIPTAQVQMRFVAADLGLDSTVEAAIDDFIVVDANCGDGIGTIYCVAAPNSTGAVSTIVGSGSTVISQNDLVLTAVDLPPNSFGYFVVSRDRAFVANPGGSQGNLCVGANTGRYISQLGNSGAAGRLVLTVDATAIPHSTGTSVASPGDTINFQCWHRDANPGSTSNMTRGYAVLFQ